MSVKQKKKTFFAHVMILLFPQRPFLCFLSQNIAKIFLWQSSPLPYARDCPTIHCSVD